jgi:hypothetical protein
MGCDIHLYVEKSGPNGWEHVPPPEGWNSEKLDMSGGGSDWMRETWFWDRDYTLFAYLAGVRNYSEQEPISEPRGLPKDVSSKVAALSEDYGIDGHSHTWLSLSEIRSDFNVKHEGFVAEKVYLAWKASGETFPAGWCGGTSQPCIAESEYKSGVRPELNERQKPYGFYIGCVWEVPATESFKRFYKLLRTVAEYAGSDARLVFWFDN